MSEKVNEQEIADSIEKIKQLRDFDVCLAEILRRRFLKGPSDIDRIVNQIRSRLDPDIPKAYLSNSIKSEHESSAFRARKLGYRLDGTIEALLRDLSQNIILQLEPNERLKKRAARKLYPRLERLVQARILVILSP